MTAFVLALALAAQTGSPAAAPAPQARPEIAAEVQRGITAYNAGDIAYYQSSLAADAVYIADDGAAPKSEIVADLAARADELVALRVSRHVLRRELRHGLPGRDWSVDADSLSLRAFRGTAIVCAADSVAAEVVVAYRGDRAPDPSKDSVLLVTADGRSAVRALTGTGVASTPCPGSPVGATARWRSS